MIEPSETLLKSWKLQRRNLETLLSSEWGWLPLETDENVDKDLAPNVDGMLIERVECPRCGKKYKFIQLSWPERHTFMCSGEKNNESKGNHWRG